ncbi:MAG: class I SAM-dependent methyltransferase [Bacteroidota bacterium]
MSSEIISSWGKNAKIWAETIQENKIASRKTTNQAILDAVLEIEANTIADLGCGEGWLTRKLHESGKMVTGFDAIEDLLQIARDLGPQTYHQLDFDDIVEGKILQGAPYDLAIFNFCLYLADTLPILLSHTLQSLSESGTILIQTLHPFFLAQNGFEYKSQWLSDAWKGLPEGFVDGHAWYARTFEDWIALLQDLPDTRFSIKEVTNSEKQPVSLIITIQKSNGNA